MTADRISRKGLDLTELRTQLATTGGRDYWRSLDELAETEDFQELLHREFPEQADQWLDPVSRRNFLKLMGASLAFGGLASCTIQPDEKIVPYVRAPEQLIPGKSLFYATAVELSGVANGVLVESHMGRPTKIEGNPDHPGSLGKTSGITQASVLDLYDPDRSQIVTNAGQISTWDDFVYQLTQVAEGQKLKKGAGLRILTQTVTSPTLAGQFEALKAAMPQAVWHQYEPVNNDSAHSGTAMAFGQALNPVYDFAKAEVILSLDADFTTNFPGDVRYAQDFAAGRRLGPDRQKMNRLYVAETLPTAVGSLADHRLALSTGGIEALALRLAKELGVSWNAAQAPDDLADQSQWIGALAKDLKANAGRSLVIAGPQQAPIVHALAHAINSTLDNIGHTVKYTAPLEVAPSDQAQSIADLVAAMQAGSVDALLILGGDPVYNAPADLDFAGALDKVAFRAHIGLYQNASSQLCHWHVPQSHYLESWGDARGYDGTVSIVQPLIEPLYNSKSIHEVMGTITGQTGVPAYDIVKDHWKKVSAQQNFEAFWQQALHNGIVAGTALPVKRVWSSGTLRVDAGTGQRLEDEDLELILRPDPMVWDGRFANNGWLQETPKPITKLTWDNAALVSPATAENRGLKNEQIIQLTHDGRTIEAPVWIVPGMAAGVVAVHLGYGQQNAGRVAQEAGFNAYTLRTNKNLWSTTGLSLAKTVQKRPLACTQDHANMENRHLVRHATLDQYQKDPSFAQKEGHVFPHELTMYEDHVSPKNAWGMVIDLNSCIGCNACSVACQSENNIPVVGRDQVLNGRELHWIRVDRYYAGDLDDPQIHHQPIPCMQCENAPCETVCPVTATSHSEEGLNDMVYNRCVGTRYCANNCPYKVRRFNFLQYADRESESLKMQRNPNVTVRSRGVMEKCTYCVQRINAARIESKKSGDPITDGQIKMACEQACPTEAITFGDINDADSRVAKLKNNPRNYGILEDLNTRPRTTYLAGVKNPNPEITES